MLSCRLCLAFGEQDPEQWLENCPRRVLNIWRAYAQAEGWFTERRLAAVSAVSLKRLVALKYKPDDREDILRAIDSMANRFVPADWQFDDDEEKQPISEAVLHMMNRGGEVLKTPMYSAEIEGFDPWQQR